MGTNHHPYQDNRSSEKRWWNTPYTSETRRDENPWLKFVPKRKASNWSNPWANEDLRDYGVDVFPSKVKLKVKPTKANPLKTKFL
jgi:hypothetical protein